MEGPGPTLLSRTTLWKQRQLVPVLFPVASVGGDVPAAAGWTEVLTGRCLRGESLFASRVVLDPPVDDDLFWVLTTAPGIS